MIEDRKWDLTHQRSQKKDRGSKKGLRVEKRIEDRKKDRGSKRGSEEIKILRLKGSRIEKKK